MINQDDIAFIKDALKNFKRCLQYPEPAKDPPYYPDDSGVPPEMVDGQIDSEGWVCWRLLPSTLNEGDVAEIEYEYQIRFPDFFRAYLVAQFHLFGQLNNTRHFLMLPPIPSDKPLGPLRQILNVWKPLIGADLIPFGEYQDGAGPLMFDTQAVGHQPVVWADHEHLFSLEPESASNRAEVSPFLLPLYASFRELFEDQFLRHPKMKMS